MTDIQHSPPRGPLNALIRFCLEQKLVVAIVLVGTIFWGVLVAPFDWDLGPLPRDPVPVDAIPDYSACRGFCNRCSADLRHAGYAQFWRSQCACTYSRWT